MANNMQETNKRLSEIFGTEIELSAFEKMETPPKGWEIAETNVVYKVQNDNTILLVGWDNASELYTNRLDHFAKSMPKGAQADVPELKRYVLEHLPNAKFVEFELVVPKSEFIENPKEFITQVRNGIAKKVRQDVKNCATSFVKGFSDQGILDSIPDDFIITLDDNYNSGNCIPGTIEFREKYFPGRTQAKAFELKKFAKNWNVMRILRYVAAKNKF